VTFTGQDALKTLFAIPAGGSLGASLRSFLGLIIGSLAMSLLGIGAFSLVNGT
jgi:hypothetical protein